MAKNPQSVAVIGTGMAGLITAYILRSDPGRFDVEVFEKQDKLSLDSASITPSNTNLSHTSVWGRIDLPMRVFASGFYENLKRMYEHFDVQFSSPRFIYTLSTVSIKSNTSIRPKFIHSSNNHQIPPLRPEGLSWGSWLLEVIYLAICYYWFTACCFFIPPREIEDSNGGESFRSYLERIYLPDYYVQEYLLPLMSCVTTCTHKALLNFPAIDIIDYETKTFRKPHYTVLGGVNRVQDKLAKGLKVRYCSTVTQVQNIDNKVKVTWNDEQSSSVFSALFDHVIMAVTPDVVGAIFTPLESTMAKIPISYVYTVVHQDVERFSECRDAMKERISPDQGPFCSQAIHICSNNLETESTHEHPSSLLISTSPIVPIDPKKILHTVTFTRVLRTPTSRQITREIFDTQFPQSLSEKSKPQWRNGDGNVWLVGGWCWDGMVMLEGCIASALRIADKLDIEVPWIPHNVDPEHKFLAAVREIALISVLILPIAEPCQGTTPACCYGSCADLDNSLSKCGSCAAIPCFGLQPACCHGVCYDLASNLQRCGNCTSPPCTGMLPACCSGVCADLTASTANCGLCGINCTGAQPACCSGICTDLATSTLHCGACNATVCLGILPACCAGECTDIATDVDHCGNCNTTCTGIQPACCLGGCVDLAADPNHCGACLALPCLGLTPGCCSGTCVDLSSTSSHCGTCNTVCPPTASSCCGGICTDLSSNNSRCGACVAIPCLGIQPACCNGTCTDLALSITHCGTCTAAALQHSAETVFLLLVQELALRAVPDVFPALEEVPVSTGSVSAAQQHRHSVPRQDYAVPLVQIVSQVDHFLAVV
ncbi:hypothetical protein N7495_000579 [Penicillium taxi]|uniref:uncharacterized protein n=1 Tax=Penicillium taxi TaxID=168475 RepID=UPI002545A568|nr:uncharacterized protein N7495_000579 [Penicillium taxi]KAJ5907897.1 hypothetical protein N7495_000579 [Penicillium taxi]